MRIEVISKQDLENFKDQIIKVINDRNQDISVQNKWLRTSQVLKLLGVSAGTLHNMRVRGHIPYSKIGGTLFYSLNNIEKLLEESKSDYYQW